MDTVHTKENLVCCQIDSFSLVLHSHTGSKIPKNKPHPFSSGKQSYPSPPHPSPRKIILNSAWAFYSYTLSKSSMHGIHIKVHEMANISLVKKFLKEKIK